MNLFPVRVNKILARLTRPNLALVKMVEVAMASSDVAARNQGSQWRHRSVVWS
jgi:hypothetical protein